MTTSQDLVQTGLSVTQAEATKKAMPFAGKESKKEEKRELRQPLKAYMAGEKKEYVAAKKAANKKK